MADIRFSQDEAGLSTSPFFAGPMISQGVPMPIPTSTAPYRVPAAQPAAGPWVQLVPRPGGAGNPLRIEVLLNLPFAEPGQVQYAAQAASKMSDLVFRQSTIAPRLLQEIAAFPAGVLDPPEGPLPATARRALPPVQKITVAIVPFPSLGLDTEGTFDKPYPAAAYPVDVAVEYDDSSNLAQRDTYTFWPPVPGLPKDNYILWGFWKGETQMAVTLFHELIHIWFVYKYYYYTGQTQRSMGHGAYECPKMGFTFYDIVPATNQQSQKRPVFQDWLSQFAAEADAHDHAVKPPVEQQIPWTPWKQPCQPSR